MPLILNSRVWVLAERLYVHCHRAGKFLLLLNDFGVNYTEFDYDEVFKTTKGKYTFMSEDNFTFAQFMQLVPSHKYLSLLERIVFDSDVKATTDDNWNYYGEQTKKWYPALLDLLTLAEVEIHEAGHKLIYTSDDQTDAPISAGSDYATQAFGDMFLDYIRKELNRSYAQGLHLATMFLARKLLEASLIRVMETVFPKFIGKDYSEENHSLWYEKAKGKYQSLGTLLENAKANANVFAEDKPLLNEFITLVKPFKDETNICVHMDYKLPDDFYLKQWRIPYLLGLAAKLFKKYCNP
jgi:hypothetical protein